MDAIFHVLTHSKTFLFDEGKVVLKPDSCVVIFKSEVVLESGCCCCSRAMK